MPVTESLNAEASAALRGPAWLREARRAAAERALAAPLPSTDEEIWRYSRVGELDLARYSLSPLGARGSDGNGGVGSKPMSPEKSALPLDPDAVSTTAFVVTVDGVLADVRVDQDAARRGLEVGPVERLERTAGHAPLIDASVAAVDVFAEMNTAFSAEPLLVRVPKGLTLRTPIVVVHVITRPDTISFPRLIVECGDDSDVRVLEHSVSAHDLEALVVPVTELRAAPAARLGYLAVNELGRRV